MLKMQTSPRLLTLSNEHHSNLVTFVLFKSIGSLLGWTNAIVNDGAPDIVPGLLKRRKPR